MKSRNRLYRGLASLLAVGTMCASMPVLNFSAVQTMVGDVDLDSAVDAADVLALQEYLLGNRSLSQDAFDNADLTGDGIVNTFDLAALKKMVGSDPVSNIVYIHLSDSGITVEGDDNKVVSISGKIAKITASGQYYVDGSITDGQLYIETAAADTSDVELILTDVTMTGSSMPCIYSAAASGSEKTKITLNGTNTLTDTSAAAYTESGVIYTNNKLTVTKSSTGSLTVNSIMNTGIYADKKMNLNGGTIIVNTSDFSDTADADAIVSDNNIEIEGAVIDIDSSADGIKSKDLGIYLFDGTVTVKAGNDAVQACTEIAVSGGMLTAGGDRGLRLDAAGLLNITGGTVIATATDYQVNGNEAIDMSGSTQTIMMFDMAAEWKKDNAITIGTTSFTTTKKYDYVLISDSSLNASATYQVYVGGSQVNHSTDTSGNFKNTGTATQYYNVAVMEGGSTIDTGAVTTITYSTSGVALYDASGNVLSSSDAVSVSGSTVTIQKAGEYEVNGTSSNGQLIVSTDDTAEPNAIVQLDLTGLTISNSSVAPIYVENVGDECIISAKSGSVNTISDGTTHTDTYVNSDNETVTVNGAIFSRDDLKIKGTGTLIVNGNYEDGIVCKNDLKLWNSTIQVTAKGDGIRGNDSVRIGDPEDTDYSTLNITVNCNNGTSGGDGIKSNSTETGKGYVTINGGTININSYSDGIQAEQEFTMNGGDLTIYTYSGNTYQGSSSSSGGGWGGMGGEGNSNKVDISAKGIKAVGLYDEAGTTYQSGGNLTINGGTLNIDSTDDSLHCAGTMNLLGGTMTLASADDGMHSDNTLNIGVSGGDYNTPYVDIIASYEGVEGQNIYQYSGSVMVTSSDDGYNAAGGTDGSGTSGSGGWGGSPGGWGGNTGSTGSGSYVLNISGGYVYVNAGGDGLDSNGTLGISGGYVFVSQTGGGNSPIDCDSTWSYSGGVVVAGGSNDMFSESIPGSYSFLNQSASISANSTVTFTNSSGTVLATMTFANSAAAMVMCSPDSSVTAYTGGTVSGATYFGVSAANSNMKAGYGGTISGGTQLSSSSGGSTNPWG